MIMSIPPFFAFFVVVLVLIPLLGPNNINVKLPPAYLNILSDSDDPASTVIDCGYPGLFGFVFC